MPRKGIAANGIRKQKHNWRKKAMKGDGEFNRHGAKLPLDIEIENVEWSVMDVDYSEQSDLF